MAEPSGLIRGAALAGQTPLTILAIFAPATARAVQDDGTCWLGGTTWHGMAAMRISVSNWSTTEADADLSVDAILRCAREVAAPASLTT